MKPRYEVKVSTKLVKDVLAKALERCRNERDQNFLSQVSQKLKTGELSLSPKQFHYLCGIADVKPHNSLYRVGIKKKHFNW